MGNSKMVAVVVVVVAEMVQVAGKVVDCHNMVALGVVDRRLRVLRYGLCVYVSI